MNNSKKEIEKRTYNNLIEANTKLVDENKWLKIDYEILKKRNEKAIDYVNANTLPNDEDYMFCMMLLDILRGDDKE